MFLIAHDTEDIETIVKSPNCLKRLYNYKYIREAISEDADGLFTSHGNTFQLKIINFKPDRRINFQALCGSNIVGLWVRRSDCMPFTRTCTFSMST